MLNALKLAYDFSKTQLSKSREIPQLWKERELTTTKFFIFKLVLHIPVLQLFLSLEYMQ